MLRLFSLFGRSADMQALDDALRACGVHPILVPEAVKLTVLRLHRRGAGPAGDGFGAAAALLSYCMLGRAPFVEARGPEAADAAEARVEAAIDAGDSGDAKIILLALHAGLVTPEVAERFELDKR